MKTNEQIQSVIFAKFETICFGVSNLKREFVTSQLENVDSELFKFAAEKKAANDNYLKAENEYLLQTEVGSAQYTVLLNAIATFATEKGEKDFVIWIKDNGIIERTNEIVTDTPTRLLSWLNRTFESYISGKKEICKRKAVMAEKRAKAAEALATLRSLDVSFDDIMAAIKK